MNLAIGLTAARYGAVVANYTEVVHLLKTRDPQTGKEKVCGARCRDVITGEGPRPWWPPAVCSGIESDQILSTGKEFDVKAKCVINATGPFTDSLRKMDDQESQSICQPSAGVHIVIPGYYRSTSTRLTQQQAPPPARAHLLHLCLTLLCFQTSPPILIQP